MLYSSLSLNTGFLPQLMTNDLEETGSFNAELKATISELESQLHQLHTDQKLKLDESKSHILVSFLINFFFILNS